jgi:hypothetical protein
LSEKAAITMLVKLIRGKIKLDKPSYVFNFSFQNIPQIEKRNKTEIFDVKKRYEILF